MRRDPSINDRNSFVHIRASWREAPHFGFHRGSPGSGEALLNSTRVAILRPVHF